MLRFDGSGPGEKQERLGPATHARRVLRRFAGRPSSLLFALLSWPGSTQCVSDDAEGGALFSLPIAVDMMADIWGRRVWRSPWTNWYTPTSEARILSGYNPGKECGEGRVQVPPHREYHVLPNFSNGEIHHRMAPLTFAKVGT